MLFNLGFPGYGPLRELLVLRRLLKEGVRPDLVIVECWPLFMSPAVGSAEPDRLESERINWTDLAALKRYSATPKQLYIDWFRSRLFPCYSSRAGLRWRWLGEPTAPVIDRGMSELDSSGAYKWHVALLTPDAQARRRELFRTSLAPILANLSICETSDRALREVLQTCRRHHIPVALLYMPEESALRIWYPDAVKQQLSNYIAKLCREHDAAFIDARTWVADELFSDYVHLLPEGTATFTRLLEDASTRRLLAVRADQALAPRPIRSR
jgi:hypothetical protein